MQQGDHELYHHALKHYDLDLALETAQALDMDPKGPGIESFIQY